METSTIIYLIRHGAVVNPLRLVYSSVRDVSLSQSGISQIREVGERIKEKGDKINGVIASPLKRTKQCMAILSDVFPDAKIEESADLTETVTHNLVGRRLSWLRSLEDSYGSETQERYSYSIESIQLQSERVNRVIQRCITEYIGKCCVIVGHGHPLMGGYYLLLHPGCMKWDIKEIKKIWHPKWGGALRLEIHNDGTVAGAELFHLGWSEEQS